LLSNQWATPGPYFSVASASVNRRLSSVLAMSELAEDLSHVHAWSAELPSLGLDDRAPFAARGRRSTTPQRPS
jgi:hypothetical protein